ncbi:hypothetical protein PBAL39_04953 [Pedobacter sp. BAL39]|nr:hypothetical protein PBAL39_04953 [Pedobacter sp. BAL39]
MFNIFSEKLLFAYSNKDVTIGGWVFEVV